MIDYLQFTQALEVCVKHKIKLSHISNMVSKGFTKVELLVNSDLVDFRFWGHHLHTQHFKPKESFFTESKLLHSQEPLGYALLNSCIDAENSTIDLGIPQTYKVILEVSGESSYRCTVSIRKGVREKTSLSANPKGNYVKFKSSLEGYLDEKVRKAHIDSVLEDGFRFVELDVFDNGRLQFVFGGENSYVSSFNSLEEFERFSERLDELEGLGVTLVDSCVDAEKSAAGGVPSNYKIVIHITDAEIFKYKVAVPQS